jgi:hypothetical protein
MVALIELPTFRLRSLNITTDPVEDQCSHTELQKAWHLHMEHKHLVLEPLPVDKTLDVVKISTGTCFILLMLFNRYN